MEDSHYIPSAEEQKTPKEKAEAEETRVRRRSASEMLRDIMAGKDVFGRNQEAANNPEDDEEDEDDEESLEGGTNKKRKKRFARKFSQLFRSRIATRTDAAGEEQEAHVTTPDQSSPEVSRSLGLNFFDVVRSQSSEATPEQSNETSRPDELAAAAADSLDSPEALSETEEISVNDILQEVSAEVDAEEDTEGEAVPERVDPAVPEPESIGTILSRQSAAEDIGHVHEKRSAFSSDHEADHDKILHAANKKAVRASATAFVGAELMSRSRDRRLDAKIEAQKIATSRLEEQQMLQERINHELQRKLEASKESIKPNISYVEKTPATSGEGVKPKAEAVIPKPASPEIAERHVRAIEQIERAAVTSEAAPEIVLKSVEKAAEKNAPIEQLFEKRHEIKGSVDPVDRSFFKDNEDQVRRTELEAHATAQRQFEAEQREKLLKLAAEGQSSQNSVYQQAATTGFWVAVILIVVFMVLYAAFGG